MSRTFFAGGAALFALGLSSCASNPAQPTALPTLASVERRFAVMGTFLDVRIHARTRAEGLAASEAILRAVQDDELRLSTWVASSELSRVNRAAVGKPQAISAPLKRDLENAVHCSQATNFAFSPWVGPLVRAWGLREGGKIPDARELARARNASQPGAFTVMDHEIVKNRAGANIEEGGFGKGVALDDAVYAALAKLTLQDVILNFGGQVSISGVANETVPIEIADPAHRDRTLLRFEASGGSIATSGNSVHGMTVETSRGPVRIGHLLDPRAGKPAPLDGSVTIAAATGAEADCLSKVFVLGESQGLQWARLHHAQVLWISPSVTAGRWTARPSCDWKAPLTALSTDVEIQPKNPDCRT